MRALLSLLSLVLLTAGAVTSAAEADCPLTKIADLAVAMSGTKPLVHAQINGSDVVFMIDSGAFYSMIAREPAARLKLRLDPPDDHFALSGVGGQASYNLTTVKTFTLAGQPIQGLQFMVAGVPFGDGAVGLLGQNILGFADAEYDLGHGVVRLIRRSTCPGAVLAYWVSPGETYSVAPINRTAGAGLNALTPSTMTAAYLNGVKLKVILDTGAESSLLSLAAAARAGVRPGDPGVRAAGQTHGIGRDAVETWIADFDSFKIGNEEIRHAKLRFGKMANMDVDMLLGADFFLSHRIFVANSQNKVYFTYNGGRVFDLSAPSASPTAQTLPTPPPAGAGPGPTAKDADAR